MEPTTLKRHLHAIVDLVLSRSDSEATSYPFWYVARRGGPLKIVQASNGIWFSRDAAEEHLEAKRHWYGPKAFVYCDSAHVSYSGLRELYDLAKEAKRALEADDTPECAAKEPS